MSDPLPKDVIAFLMKENPTVPDLEPGDITARRAADLWGVTPRRALDVFHQMEREGKGTLVYKVNRDTPNRNRELVFVPKR